MQFCEECGSMMVSEDGEMVCTDCGHAEVKDEERAAEFASTESQQGEELIEVEEGADEGLPTTEEECESCGNDTAWYTLKQTASADEPPTRFFKCTECEHRWRGYN